MKFAGQAKHWAYIRILIILLALVSLGFYAANGAAIKAVTAVDFVDLQQGNTVFEGYRRAHAKGFCISGDLVSNNKLMGLTESKILVASRTPFIGRVSISGANPFAADLDAKVRSMALRVMGEDGQIWQTAMNTAPVMAVRTPQDFYRQLEALQSGTIATFLAEHPESADFQAWAQSYTPSTSFATESYHSINAFYLVDANRKKRAVRWYLRPHASAQQAVVSGNPNALQDEFKQRLATGTVKFDLVFIFANADDDETDPTVSWLQYRQQLVVGELHIQTATSEHEGDCNQYNFDPLVLPKGLSATEDPILNARSAAYAESYKRRAYETWLSQLSR